MAALGAVELLPLIDLSAVTGYTVPLAPQSLGVVTQLPIAPIAVATGYGIAGTAPCPDCPPIPGPPTVGIIWPPG